jgi:hypothetical protein
MGKAASVVVNVWWPIFKSVVREAVSGCAVGAMALQLAGLDSPAVAAAALFGAVAGAAVGYRRAQCLEG